MEVTARYERCERGPEPVYLPFNRSLHVAAPENLGALMHNAAEAEAHANRLNATLRCYETQAAGGAR